MSKVNLWAGGLKRNRRRQSGLSLIEVMVALAILASVAVAIISLVSQNTRFLAITEQRLVAGIVAENELVRVLLTERAPQEGDDLLEVTHAETKWTVRRNIINVGDGIFRIQIDVRVSGSEQVLMSIETIKTDLR